MTMIELGWTPDPVFARDVEFTEAGVFASIIVGPDAADAATIRRFYPWASVLAVTDPPEFDDDLEAELRAAMDSIKSWGTYTPDGEGGWTHHPPDAAGMTDADLRNAWKQAHADWSDIKRAEQVLHDELVKRGLADDD